ncbi:hypothetical protein C0991_012487 [Blastosporella zonata]|nr:hypothetical protein C0991_012487 [Blastosporella zonata]
MQPSSTLSKPFPGPVLVALSVLSCFVATAAIVSAFTQINSHFGYFIVPSAVGALATIPYHVYMYKLAKAHPTQSDSVFISNDWIMYNFLLISLWAVIFIINILFCVGEGTAGCIVTTIWSGIQWILLLLLAVITIVQIRHREGGGQGPSERQPLLDAEAGPTLASKTKFIYFVSYTLCTLCLVIGIDVHLPICFTILTFFLTAPHHIALYIASVRPNTPFNFLPFLSRPTNVAYAFFLPALWFVLVLLEIVFSRFAYQSILLGIFGGLESLILAYLTVRGVLDSISSSGGQIKL